MTDNWGAPPATVRRTATPPRDPISGRDRSSGPTLLQRILQEAEAHGWRQERLHGDRCFLKADRIIRVTEYGDSLLYGYVDKGRVEPAQVLEALAGKRCSCDQNEQLDPVYDPSCSFPQHREKAAA